MPLKPSKRARCVYCLCEKRLTKDHVVARCFFPEPLPNFLVTVPACEDCQRRKSLDESFFRDLLVSDIEGSESPIARGIFHEKTLRSLRKGNSLLGRIVLREGRHAWMKNEAGVITGTCVTARFDGSRVERLLATVVRGLYFARHQHILPVDCEFEVKRLMGRDAEDFWHLFRAAGASGLYRLGDGVFCFAYMHAAEEPAITQWFMGFYGRVFFRVGTQPKGFKWPSATNPEPPQV